MSAEENMALARRFLTALVKGDLDTMDEMMALDYVSHTPYLPEQGPGREGLKWAVAQFAGAITNVSQTTRGSSRDRPRGRYIGGPEF